MIEYAIVAVGAIVFFIAALILISTSAEKDKTGIVSLSIAFLFLAGVLIAISANGSGIEKSEGLPVGSSANSFGYLPPEDIPQLVKTVDWEDPESIIYLTLVPYNNINSTRMLYRISWDDCETSINFSIGMRIVNNNGRIEQV